jgi:hypothetical protein
LVCVDKINSGKLQGALNAFDFSQHAGRQCGDPFVTTTLDQKERRTLSPVRGQGGHQPGFAPLAGINPEQY